jgi:hypothetical protein
MATFKITHQQRIDDVAVVQTLESTDIAIGQSITIAGCDASLNGTHTVIAVPTHLFRGLDDEGDPWYDDEVIILNQLMIQDAGADIEREPVSPYGTLTWTQTCTWIVSADVEVFLGISAATANDTAFLAQAVNASNAWCFARRVQAGYHDSLTTVPSDAVKMGAILYAAGLYRERGSIDSFQSFEAMGAGGPVMTMGRVNQLLGIKRSQVA